MSKKEEKHNFTLIRSRFKWEKDPPDETESFSIFREEVIFVRTVRRSLLLLRRNSKGKTKGKKKECVVQLGSEKLHLNCTCRRNLNEFYFSFFFFFLFMCISRLISHLMDSSNPYSINFEFDWPAFSVVEPHSSLGNMPSTVDKNNSYSIVRIIPF